MIEDEIYDVNSYSEKELLDILDLFHPTDRELEAKILSYIDKYSEDSDSNPDTLRLHTFFTHIYKRFFYIEDEHENADVEIEKTEIVEGFDSILPQTTDKNVQLVSSLTFARGKLNPILKQTYQRIITIDSQYRDSKSSLSTQYTFNFTETLKDVVSLKLYAVQIPYTWYTISKSYGSNFIYIKGNVPGIDNGLHDISINIPVGNYSLTTISNSNSTDNNKSISGAIQNAIQELPGIYTDVSFGSTNLLYNINQCKSTFTIDIQKHYNENAYYFHFPGTLYSPEDSVIDNINRSNNLFCFLGFNSSSYSTCSFYSSRNVNNTLDNIESNYFFDANNNYINIIQYYTDSTNDYIHGVSMIYQTLKITFPITVANYRLSQKTIYTIVNNTIMNDSRFVDSSVNLIPIKGKDPSENTFDSNGKSYFQWQFKLNRYNGNNIPQYKTVLQVPYYETSDVNPVWIGPNSCFYFDNSYNELNNLISETYVFSSNFEIIGNIYYSFICNDGSYNRASLNDFSYNLTQNNIGYSLNGYLTEINDGFTAINKLKKDKNGDRDIFNVDTTNNTTGSQSLAYINTDDSKFHMSIDMNKYFYTDNFRIFIGNTFLSNSLNFSPTELNGNTILVAGNTFEGVSIPGSGYSPNKQLLMAVYPDGKYFAANNVGNSNSYRNGISLDISYHVYLTGKFRGMTALQNGINDSFKTFTDSNLSNPLKYMNISITANAGKFKSILTVNVTKVLTQNDYTIHFYDDNVNNVNKSSWNQNLKLDKPSYNLANYRYGSESFADISGNDIVNSDTINLNDGINNQFQLIPIEEGVTGAGTLTFDIPAGSYNRINLFNTINGLFDSKPETYGTRISFITKSDDKEYTKIRWNVNKIYTSKDYRLVFYDLYSFVSCFLGNSSIRNATWDTTLGWIMGFHDLTEYPLTTDYLQNGYYYDISNSSLTNNIYSLQNKYITDLSYNPIRTIVNLKGDTTVSVNLYNYFMVILDDFNPSHLNDGLITITPADNNLSLPSYANRAKYICDPVTKQVLNTGITDIASNNLTQNQIYSINQIINKQNTPKSYTSQGVYVSDIFGLIPIKTTGYSPGQVYVEYGGTLQAQDRVYFGPVNIHRMAISLLNDRGEIVDLNGANWSLQFICEQLYQNNNDIKS